MKLLSTLALLLATVAAVTAEPPKAVKTDDLKDKVSVAPGEDFALSFQRDGNKLTQPAKPKEADATNAPVKVRLATTTAAPVAPPREGAMRPFLAVENGFEKPLQFRVLVRMKGSKEFFETKEDMEPVAAGETFTKCWGFDDQVEEVVLYEFKLSDKHGK